MKKCSKIVILAIVFIISLFIISEKSYAANFELDVNFDGTKIDLTSETPDMSWSVNNLLPGESDETYLTISNVGKKEVNVDFIASIVSGEDLAKILDIKVIKLANDANKEDEEFFSGKYSELMNLNTFLEVGKEQKYKIITSLPIETGNEFQNKECKIKLSFVARGEEDRPDEPDEPDEPGTPSTPTTPSEPGEPEDTDPPKEIIQTVVKPPQTGESKAIYVIFGVLIIAVLVVLITFFAKKKDKE